MSEQNTGDFPLPPPPPFPVHKEPEGPQMSTGQTLSSIFFEPGTVFEALRSRPRFLAAGLILLACLLAFTTLLYQKVGYENVIRAAIENSPQAANMTPEQKERAIAMQTSPVFKAIGYGSPLIGVAIFIAAGGALYLLGSLIADRRMSYKQSLAVWVYSSMPPNVLKTVLNIVLLYLTSPDSYDPVQASRRGLVRANLGFLVDATAHPMLATLLGAFDILDFYGLFLAAVGLRTVGRMSAGTAWSIVLIVWLLGLLMRLGFSGMIGGAM